MFHLKPFFCLEFRSKVYRLALTPQIEYFNINTPFAEISERGHPFGTYAPYDRSFDPF